MIGIGIGINKLLKRISGGASGGGPAPIVPTTWDPTYVGGGTITLSNGNRHCYLTTSNNSSRSVVGKTSGKHYVEMRRTSTPASNALYLGLRRADANANTGSTGVQTNTIGYLAQNPGSGNVYSNNTPTYVEPGTNPDDWIGLAVDLDNGTIRFYVNGVVVGAAASSIPGWSAGQEYFLSVGAIGSQGGVLLNAGQEAFVGSVPVGFTGGWG